MKAVFIILLMLVFWSASVTLYVKNYPPARSSVPLPSCPKSPYGTAILEALEQGTILGIQDNGQVLTISMPNNWAALPTEDQRTAIHQVSCYAKELNRQIHYILLPHQLPAKPAQQEAER